MKRREFISLVGGALVAWPRAVRAQQPTKVWRIGYLGAAQRMPVVDGFLEEMRALGYVEGKNFTIEWRFAQGDYERLPELAADLVRLKVDVIVCGAGVAVTPAQHATDTIPIVMAYSVDPVGRGFVKSLREPGGNTTGLASSQDDVTPKLLELLATAVPGLSRVGILDNSHGNSQMLKYAETVAPNAGLTLVPAGARNASEIENAFATFTAERVDAVVIGLDATFFAQRRLIAEIAMKRRVTTIYGQREFVEAGGVMSFGENDEVFFCRWYGFIATMCTL